MTTAESIDAPAVDARNQSAARFSPTRARVRWHPSTAIVIASFDVAAIVIVTGAGGRWTPTSLALSGALLFTLWASADYRRPRVNVSALIELPRLLGKCAVPLLLLAIDATVQAVDAWVFRYVVFLTGALVAGRFLSFALVRYFRRRGTFTEPTLVIGAGVVAHQLGLELRRHPEFGLDPIGVVDEVPADDPEQTLPLLGVVSDIPAIIQRFGVTRVVLAYGLVNDMHVVQLMRTFPGRAIEIYIVPRLFEAGGASGDPLLEEVRGIPLVWLRRRASRRAQLRAKRAFDVVMSSLLLLLTGPILVVAAASVALTSRGPVFLRQRRVGRNGKPFDLLKFRSMRVNDDSDTTWSVRRDERVTPVGRVLRRTSIDELPQLLNIIRGDMSLVGPRPERPHFVDQFSLRISGYDDRHRCPVGLTGLAQISGLRGDTSIDDRVRVDNAYIDQWSIWRDLVILARTFAATVRGD